MKTAVQTALDSLFSITTLGAKFTEMFGDNINQIGSWSDMTRLLSEGGIEKVLSYQYSKTETALVALVLAMADYGHEAAEMSPDFLSVASVSLTPNMRQVAAMILTAS